MNTINRTRKTALLGGSALAVLLLGSTGAWAQNCVVPAAGLNYSGIASSAASVSGMLGTTIAAANTAFALQSTAFVGAPPNPAADQQGGGVWVRGVGGSVDLKTTTTTNASSSAILAPATIQCAQQVRENFTGIQFGADVSRLNVNGWNLHLGTTAGVLETKGNLRGGAFAFNDPGPVGGGPFTSSTQVPFIGTYAAATYGSFAVDALLRTELYQNALNAPLSNIFNQNIDARGVTFASSALYQFQVPDSKWFIEPSAGIIISRVKVDPLNYVTAGTPGTTSFNGNLQLNEIRSNIGRAGVRVGTTVDGGNLIWQPFAAASIWHEFGPNITSNYATCQNINGGPGCAFIGIIPITISAASSTTTFGTYGQYSLGTSVAVPGTGWLGFVRGDYRSGSNLHGVSGTGGVRYQFTPDEPPRRTLITKAPVKALPPVVEAVNWTGFYVGGFGGATEGRADWNFAGGAARPRIGNGLFGGNAGYNYQNGSWVFGVEGDLGSTHAKGGIACAQLLSGPLAGGPAAAMFQMTCNAQDNWIATATARVGYAWERALFYVKGGGAWTNERFTATCNLSPVEQVANGLILPNQQCTNPARIPLPANALTIAASDHRGGGVVGFGTEFALTRNWSAKAEYDFIVFGKHNVTASDGSVLNIGSHVSEAKVGVNYRWN